MDEAAQPPPPPEFIVCRRYEIIYEYARELGRPLTSLERRAFLPLLDLEADERYAHADGPECVCLEIMPHVIQALDPDPVECVVAERTLENQICPARRWHTEKVERHQGIVLGLKTQKEHTDELKRLAKQLLKDMETVLREILRRPVTGYPTSKAMVEAEFSKLYDLAKLVAQRPKRGPSPLLPAVNWMAVQAKLERERKERAAVLAELQQVLVRWDIR